MSHSNLLRILVLASIIIGSLGLTMPRKAPAMPAEAQSRGGNRERIDRVGREKVAFLLAAGDIAVCGEPHGRKTAALLKSLPGTVATLGDNVYEQGSREEFSR